ncbi:MAG TPA: MalY/PatB family protein [Cerasibacillus sp.]|uniref:MalY/PatB family protein n=1 Tax=Cerasibacillus sp. TaxID=2498711 RepID=UPI002F3FC7F7
MTQFNTIHQRKNTKSIKWDALQDIFQADDILPMWVADMDFSAPQPVLDTLSKRIQHGIFGYTMIDQEVKESIVNWLERRHQWGIQTDWLTFSPGVVTSLHMAVQALTNPKDKVLIQTPVYTPFYQVIESHDREIVKNPLIYENGTYHIDFVDLDEKLKEAKAFILCSPHNPVGRVWRQDELIKIATLCEKHDVLLFSDEIHADLIYPNHKHIPIASLSKEMSMRTITCMSPSKTFNLAGLQASYIVTENPSLKEKIDASFQKQGLSLLNTMGTLAMEAAYSHGEAWLDELRNVLTEHVHYVIETLEAETDLRVIRPEGTYLVWVDCQSLGLKGEALQQFMIEKAKVGLNAGFGYGIEGEQFMRINIACPRETLEEGMKRIVAAVQSR